MMIDHLPIVTSVLAVSVLCVPIRGAVPEEVQIAVARLIGHEGTYARDEGVYRVVIPREEATIVLDYQTLSPNLGLNSWAAFSSAIHEQAIFRGQLLLLEDEVNPVLDAALRGRFEITGLAVLLPFDGPSLRTLDLTGIGTFSQLASDFRKCLDEIRRVRQAATSQRGRNVVPMPPIEGTIDPAPLDAVLSMRGCVVSGVYRAVIGRRVLLHGETIGRDMGICTWFSFAGSDDQAVVHGEFVEDEGDLKRLLAAIRAKRMDVISITNHLTGEHPPVVFVHFRAKGDAVQVAHDLRYVLDAQVGQVR